MSRSSSFTVSSPVDFLSPFSSHDIHPAGTSSRDEGFTSLTVQEFVSKLEALSAQDVQVQQLPAGQSVVIARNFTPASVPPEELPTVVVIHHFLHGNEGELVEKVKAMPSQGELWIVGNDDAAGIGALGVAAGLIAEEAQFAVHSVLFEDVSLSVEERDGWVRSVRQNPKILEDHLKVTDAGEVLVRRAVQGSPSVRPAEIKSVGYSKNAHGNRSVAAAYPPPVGPGEVEVVVEAFGLIDLEAETPLTAFVGTANGQKVLGYSYQKLVDTIVVDKAGIIPLIDSIPVADAASLPTSVLLAWVGLVELGRVEKNSVVLVHDALSREFPASFHAGRC